MKKVLLMSAMALFVFAAQAQVKFGATAGINLANISQNYKESDDEEATKMRLAPKLGVVVDYGISDELSFRSGLVYSSKGYSDDLEDGEDSGVEVDGYSRNIVNYLEIPLTAVYKIGVLELTAGPYVAFALSGKSKSDYEYTSDGNTESVSGEIDYEFGKERSADSDKPMMKGFDAGITLGVGYSVGPGVVNLTYSKGLSNLTPKEAGSDFDPADAKMTNSVIGLSFTYFFGM